MSFFSKIGKIAKKAIGYVAPLTGLIPWVGCTIASGIAGAVATRPKPSGPSGAPVTTAGSATGGLAQTLPVLKEQGGPSGVVGPPSPGGLMRSLGQGLGQLGAGAIQGISQQMGIPTPGVGARGATRMKMGKLTGNYIPAGYVEKMSPSGVVYLAKQRRRRGISARDISAFYRVNRLVAKVHWRAHGARRRGK